MFVVSAREKWSIIKAVFCLLLQMLHVPEAGGSGDLNSGDQGSVPRPPPSVTSSKPKIKKPPRKSKLSEEKSVKNSTLESGSSENCDDKNNEGESPAVSSSAGRMTAMMSKLNNLHPIIKSDFVKAEHCCHFVVTEPSQPSRSKLPATPGPAKSFKMLRLRKGEQEELGIIISKKRDLVKGNTGYVIAHIEPEGLIHK